MDKPQKRQIAYHVRINDIAANQYVKEEGEWAPNYVLVGDKHVSRVNLISVVVAKEEGQGSFQSITVDDGSGKISVRSFDENISLVNANVGDVVLVIGRPREYMNEKYLVAEIVKKLENTQWLEVRKKELGSIAQPISAPSPTVEEPTQEAPQEIAVEDIEDDDSKIISLIKDKDAGEGADTQDIIQISENEKAETIVKRLLEQGEIFEVKPGKLKVLE